MNLSRSKFSTVFIFFSVLLNAFAPLAEARTAAVRVTVSPTAATVTTGSTQQLTAQVTGTTNRKVVWSVNDIVGGNSNVGTVSISGLYAAPATIPANTQIVVKATSRANRSVFGSSIITLQTPAPTITVEVSPAAANVALNDSQQFAASVAGTSNQSVVWSVNNINGGTAQTGTINANGLYAAPNQPFSGAITVAATSQANPNAKGTATVNLISVTPTASANRFLNQATFGATPALKTRVEQIGYEAFLNEQFAAPESVYPNVSQATRAQTIDRFWSNMFKGDDQLRQRAVYALSQIWVESFNKNSEPNMMLPWLKILSKNAFGNYRTLMREMTLDASMGHYLDLVNSNKPDGTNAANENYPRELMQLFSIGLYKLNADGSFQIDANNRLIPVYSQADVRGLALALTGWTYPTTPGQTPQQNNGGYYPGAMEPRQINHDTTAKNFLGQTLPAGQTIQQDLDGALDIIFNHPNVAPFVATRLIRAFVTSNPSPAYIARISAVFENNGNGARGDLKAVIRAILLDQEAKNDAPDQNFGRLRSPVQYTIATFRALSANFNEPLDFAYLYEAMGEGILNAPSVFGHYSPMYRLPNGGGLFAPEFQIYTPTESVNRANFIYQMLAENRVNISEFTNIAGNSTNLINAVDARFLDGKMSPTTRDAINQALQSSTDNRTRAITAIYLVITSGDFIVQR